jgi:hypothetical protein
LVRGSLARAIQSGDFTVCINRVRSSDRLAQRLFEISFHQLRLSFREPVTFASAARLIIKS